MAIGRDLLFIGQVLWGGHTIVGVMMLLMEKKISLKSNELKFTSISFEWWHKRTPYLQWKCLEEIRCVNKCENPPHGSIGHLHTCRHWVHLSLCAHVYPWINQTYGLGNVLNVTGRQWTEAPPMPVDGRNEVLTHHIIPPSRLSHPQCSLSMHNLEQRVAAAFANHIMMSSTGGSSKSGAG